MVNLAEYNKIVSYLSPKKITLVAVSKTKPVDDILALYQAGQKHFAENYVQELADKYNQLPQDIHWHFIGHLQTNKVKLIAPFVYLIHSIDSLKLLSEVNKQAEKSNRVIDCLLQVHIAREETKFGLDETELVDVLNKATNFKHVHINGLMGMASFSNDTNIVRNEFSYLSSLFKKYRNRNFDNVSLNTLSMGMSGDYIIAVEEGSTMVRIGSLLFGARS